MHGAPVRNLQHAIALRIVELALDRDGARELVNPALARLADLAVLRMHLAVTRT